MIVLDTSFLVAFWNELDSQHARAMELMRRIDSGEWLGCVLMDYVLLETAAVMLQRCGFQRSRGVCNAMMKSENFAFMACSDYFQEYFAEFNDQLSGKLSLVDCAIAYVARTRAEGRVATFDEALRSVPGIVGVG